MPRLRNGESRYRAAERWLSNVVQGALRECTVVTTADVIKLVLRELELADPWLRELLPPERVSRALAVNLNIDVAKPIHKLEVTLVAGPEESES